MKRSLLALFLLLTLSAKAQYVGLNDKEVQTLKGLTEKDAGVKKMFDAYQALADVAVNVSPGPIDTIRTEGLLKGNPKKEAASTALRDMARMYALAIVFRISGEKEYLQNLRAYFAAWAKTNISRGDPIDDTNLEPAIEAYDLVKAKLSPKENEPIVNWFKQIADAEIASHQKSMDKETSFNNWNSHRLKIVGLIAYATNNDAYKKYVDDDLKIQLAKNLRPDGSTIDFTLRDALHYDVYDLEPLLRLAIVIKRATGADEYNTVSSAGSSLKKSVEWLVPYLNGTKTHAEFVKSTVKFDQERAANGEADYKAGSQFDAKNGAEVLALAAYFDPKYIDLVKTIRTMGSDWQLVLDKVMM